MRERPAEQVAHGHRPRSWARLWVLAVCAASVCGCGVRATANPLVVESFERSTPGGTARGWMARVDLADPGVRVLVSAGADEDRYEVDGCEAVLTRTDRWALDAGVRLACNANYFGKGRGGAGCSDIIGLAVSEGRLISPARVVGGKPDPALVVMRDGRARVGHIDTPASGEVLQAVAGVGEGTLLVSEGKNLGATARVDPLKRHPRTAAGVSADGRTLWLVVVDGRQAGWSVGMTLPELGELMVGAGAWDAVNLDGGGSSAFWYRAISGAGGAQVLTNRPSDGSFRPVANQIGVLIREDHESLSGVRPSR